MPEHDPPDSGPTVEALQAEVVRLNKVIRALMNRAERNHSLTSSDFSLFHTAITLEEKVRHRTMELEAARLENERITRDLRQSEEQIRRLAFHDALTNVANRRLLTDRLNLAMAASARSGWYGAVLLLDLDNFKPLNDTHGHDVGDLLLIEVASRLTRSVRAVDTVARVGGDEFVVVLAELDADHASSIDRSRIVADKLRAALAEPYVLTRTQAGKAGSAIEYTCGASIGVALFLGHHASQDEILRHADVAMYQAKREGRKHAAGLDARGTDR